MMRWLVILLFLSQTCSAQTPDINFLKNVNVYRNKNLDGTMVFLSDSEYLIGFGVPLSAIGYAFIKKDSFSRQTAIQFTAAVLLNTAVTYGLKRGIDRPRPSVIFPFIQAFENDQRFSFPSGHTSNAFCIATTLSLMKPKWYVIAPSFIWAGAVGYSRMHLGMHYPTDVMAGALVGAGSAWVTYKVNTWWRNRCKSSLR
jgi:membrane-associated phospholipid phosphatase